MGTMISLDIGRFEIDYGKNDSFYNHSHLFQLEDKNKMTYYYADDLTDVLYGYTKKLHEVKDRLDVLGYTLNNLNFEYNKIISTRNRLKGFLTFEQLLLFIKSIDISEIVSNGVDWSADLRFTYGLGYLINYKPFSKYLPKYFRKTKYIEEDYDYLPMYLLLRMLAENPKNYDFDVNWRIGDTIRSGWITWDDVVPTIDINRYIWIVTEGKTDSEIIKRSIEIIFPHISDLFKYIDMRENYPFTGTGELTKFFKGLIKINVINKMLFIFDNDTEGISKYNELKGIVKPNNLLLCHLPNLECFNDFATVGPTGENKSNINGRAVSIECFLDLYFSGRNPAIRWSNFNEKMNQYQGALIEKESYVKEFKDKNIKNSDYDLSKLKYLIEHLLKLLC